MTALPINPTERDRERFRDITKAMQLGMHLEYDRYGNDSPYKNISTETAFRAWWSAERERRLLQNLNQSQGVKLTEWENKYAVLANEYQATCAAANDTLERLEKAEAELAKAREQEPVAWLIPQSTLVTFDEDWARKNTDYCDPLFLAPVAAPAVLEEWLKCWLIERPASPEWPAIWLTITTDGRRWVSDGGTMYATGGDWYFTSAASEALKFADKESADEYVRHNKIKDVVVTEHIFDNRAMLQSAPQSEVRHD